ncbi:Uncharacterised protein [Nocardia otitidiscaviarum]|uniref:Uncharacterized protein n=1 Tax=Nocardia otitidiscaviarum TaxID=1823 RepID=A0A378Y8C4_9NOCA|nr:hypothetical protein [Nocardia otitidiscaviarum]SUA72627.1 Uncharacterised protein [Nocardia otitidiscaviarum]SUA72687.1 Uncharacterised protein [Nocardia otitidiscaviarum]
MSWEYRVTERTEREFEMLLTYEESLTIEALRAFVAATENLDATAYVEIETRHRQHHDKVIALVARVNTYSPTTVDGPQPGPRPCPPCGGEGFDDLQEPCVNCEGTGRIGGTE